MRNHLIKIIFGSGLVLLPFIAAASEPSYQLVPAKLEVSLAPGERAARELVVTNQTGAPVNLAVSLEDIAPGSSSAEPVALRAANTSTYSLLPYLSLPLTRSRLAAGESLSIPVIINLPANLGVSGLYGAVIISFAPVEGTASAVSRLGSLLFVRLSGVEKNESGRLLGFGPIGNHFFKTTEPPAFHIDYENRGNVYLNPYGLITITNRLTGRESKQGLDPWFVLPESARSREVNLSEGLPLGFYRVKLELNLGFADTVTEQQTSIFVWSYALLIFIIIFLIGLKFGLKVMRFNSTKS
ncbi:MAG: hypothetical protein AAB455_02895 [Patescibacteria group bacterium]